MKSQKWVILVVVLVLVAALMLLSCTSTSAPTPTTTPTPGPVAAKTLKFDYSMPKGQSLGAGFEWFATEFPKRTNGRYKVETYPSSTLVSMPAALDSLKKGIVQFTFTSTGTFPKDFPLSRVITVPTLGFSLPDVEKHNKAFAACWELYNTVPEVKGEYKDVVLLWPSIMDAYNLVSKKKEVHTPKDFAGMKVGGSGSKMEWVTTNGGAYVQMIPPQSYEMLEKGVIEAAFINFAQVADYKIWEICDYFYTMEFDNALGLILMNKEAYDALGAADQKILMDLWKEASVECTKGAISNVAKGKEGTVKAGKKITAPTPAEIAAWENTADIVIQKWVKDTKALGVDEATTLKVLDAWKKIRPKYL